MEEKTPIIPKKIELEDEGKDIYEVIEEKVFPIKHNNENYLLNISKTNKESILFKLKLDKEFITEYYQKNYKLDSLKKKSEIFSIYGTLEESYSIIIENLEENNAKDITLEFSKNCAKIILDFKLLLNKKKTIFFDLAKKEVNIGSILNKLNDKIIKFQGNQAQLEGKVKEIDELLNKKKVLENELKTKIEEISKIKNAQNDLENSIKESKISIKEISNEQKKNFNQIKEISSKNEKFDKKYEEMNENLSKKYLMLNESIKSFQKSFEKTNHEIDLIKQNQEFIKNKFEKKEKEYDLISKWQSKYEETYKNDIKKLINEIDLLKYENSGLKRRIEELEKKEENKMKEEDDEDDKYQNFEKYTNLKNKKEESDEDEYENKEENKDDKLKNDPRNFIYEELISQDLFKQNFYNNRACIFTSFRDKKIYIAYGEKSLNLEGYDVLDSEKFTIKEKIHTQSFDSLRYYYCEKEELDLLITASLDSHVKIIDFRRDESLVLIDLDFESNQRKIINTAYFINDYIMVPFSNSQNGTVHLYEPHYNSLIEPYKYKDKIEGNAGFILGLSSWYSGFKYYALVANTEGIFSYIISKFLPPKLHHKFIPSLSKKENENNGFDEAYIIEKDDKCILIGPCFYYGYLFFWDFFKGDLIHKMNLESGISDISLWDNDYLFASLNHSDHQFVLINVYDKVVENNFDVETEDPRGCGVKVLKNDSHGNYLISVGIDGNLHLFSMDPDIY